MSADDLVALAPEVVVAAREVSLALGAPGEPDHSASSLSIS
jgi:hypothetical protein